MTQKTIFITALSLSLLTSVANAMHAVVRGAKKHAHPAPRNYVARRTIRTFFHKNRPSKELWEKQLNTERDQLVKEICAFYTDPDNALMLEQMRLDAMRAKLNLLKDIKRDVVAGGEKYNGSTHNIHFGVLLKACETNNDYKVDSEKLKQILAQLKRDE